MAALNDLKNQRDVAVQSVRAAVERAQAVDASTSVRALSRLVKQLHEAIGEATSRQLAFMTKAGSSANDEVEAVVIRYLQCDAVEAMNSANEELESRRVAAQAAEIAATFTTRVQELQDNLDMLHVDTQGEVSDDDAVALVEEHGRLEEAIRTLSSNFDEAVAAVQDADKRTELEVLAAGLRRDMTKRSRRNLKCVVPLRSRSASNSRAGSVPVGIPVPQAGAVGSMPSLRVAQSAPSIGQSGTSEEHGSSSIHPPVPAIRTKKYDFPKFSGNARHYAAWRRDFRAMAQRSPHLSSWELSNRIRHDCLEGEARDLCIDVEDYDELWRLLDDTYSDPDRIVDEVDMQLAQMKKVDNRDYQAFISMVDTLERAQRELRAADRLDIICNTRTCRLVASRCPDWVLPQVVAGGLSSGGDFVALLQHLTIRRSEARRLHSLQAAERGLMPPPAAPPRSRDVRRAAVNAVAANVDGSDTGRDDFRCLAPGCGDRVRHFLSKCEAWVSLTPAARAQVVNDKRLCILCFSPSHQVDACSRRSRWRACGIGGCPEMHNRAIHGGTPPAASHGVALSATAEQGETLLLVQSIPLGDGGRVNTFWDTGAGLSLIETALAEQRKYPGDPCHLALTTVSGAVQSYPTKRYLLSILDMKGNKRELVAYGVPTISGVVTWAELRGPRDSVGPRMQAGRVQLLIGMSNSALHPRWYGELPPYSVYTSEFGCGWLAGGGSAPNPAAGVTVNMASGRVLRPADFISAEAMGVDIPKLCKNCVSCRECNYKATHLSWQENYELSVIEAGLTLDTDKKLWTADYPFRMDPSQLTDNRTQAISMMASFERRLKKACREDEFNRLFAEHIERGVFKEVDPEEYDGATFYVTVVEAYKAGPAATTPIRLCINSSLRYGGLSLNDILYKGPSALNDLVAVALGFRQHRVALIKDIKKFYQTIAASERSQHVRRLVWRDCDPNKPVRTFVTSTVNFGDRPAGCISQVALRETAKLYAGLSERAADMIINHNYVDDLVGGEQSVPAALELSQEVNEIGSHGGFLFNPHVISTVPLPDGLETTKVLGLAWSPVPDLIAVDTRVNPHVKSRGLRQGPDLGPDEIPCFWQGGGLTRRVIWRICMGQYDPLGLLCVFLIRLKLAMRRLSGDGGSIDWDAPVDGPAADDFISTAMLLGEAGLIPFPRSIVPTDALDNEPQLIVFVDGSQQASCALAYARWRVPGGWESRLIIGKTRVAPLRRISIPRMEVQGAVLGVRLATTVQTSMQLQWSSRVFLTDSTAVMGMIAADLAVFPEFLGTRLSEIRSKSLVEEWRWVPTDANLADMGTRGGCSPRDIGLTSAYQCGHLWMANSEDEWPTKKNVGTLPEGELLQQGWVCATVQLEDWRLMAPTCLVF